MSVILYYIRVNTSSCRFNHWLPGDNTARVGVRAHPSISIRPSLYVGSLRAVTYTRLDGRNQMVE